MRKLIETTLIFIFALLLVSCNDAEFNEQYANAIRNSPILSITNLNTYKVEDIDSLKYYCEKLEIVTISKDSNGILLTQNEFNGDFNGFFQPNDSSNLKNNKVKVNDFYITYSEHIKSTWFKVNGKW